MKLRISPVLAMLSIVGLSACVGRSPVSAADTDRPVRAGPVTLVIVAG